jgi:uncharacterized repeat protein (TIGR03803 family)
MRSLFVSSRIRNVILTFACFALSSAGCLWGQGGERTLFYFNGTTEGESARAGVIMDSSGALYGTTVWGGETAPGYWGGTVYKLTPPAESGSPWTESLLWEFQGGDFNNDAANPYCTLVFDKSGNLYGTTEHGGAYGAGTVFQLVPPAIEGGAWTQNVIYSFENGYPQSGLVIDANGALYGTAFYWQVFQLVPPADGTGAWTYNALYNFNSITYLNSSLTFDSKGNLYGTAEQGGQYEKGLVFGLKPPATPGGAWEEFNIYNFTGKSDGGTPLSSVTDRSGVLYGTTSVGGSNGFGTVYSLTASGSPGEPWNETILYNFLGGDDGATPEGGVVFASNSELFGTTSAGGSASDGTVFELNQSSEGGPWTKTIIHNFTGKEPDGSIPQANLLLDGGKVYGTTGGGSTVFAFNEE